MALAHKIDAPICVELIVFFWWDALCLTSSFHSPSANPSSPYSSHRCPFLNLHAVLPYTTCLTDIVQWADTLGVKTSFN
ncbi:uncharacterized protein BJ212DRAFT_1352839 [Suillus subaureus]|uniref:Secreted protein n=1 Tax=Suillus subaureus TaxID=48587 RepID=A0A9P7JDX8_9AGAM|nr:uncharacterized protein BJ212DRAFT_1352839 [Suillus subaureus]KAG1816726.1 hypothetical protein BJ212DRAFT_1352839 [Suillus subaureus]